MVRSATKKLVKAVWKTVKVTYKTIKWTVVAIAAGGWVAVIIVIILVLIGALLASPFGIFFSRGSGGDGAQEIFLPQVVQQLGQEHHSHIEEVQQNNEHDELVFEGNISIDWPQVLAVYAVMVTSDPQNPLDVVTVDDERIERLRDILNAMHSFTYRLEYQEESTKLIIHITQKSAVAMAQTHNFNADQRAMLDELLSDEFADLWAELLGGFRPGGGEILQPDPAWQGTGIFAWPVQAGFRITSSFGWRTHPISGERNFHTGMDIGAPTNTPILAMADGIVTVANATDSWGGGYGFFIRIDHGGGYETLYAHAIAIGVRVGEEVEQGQVIGWVGSTGNSTGPHLHFEVFHNGTRVNPMGYFRQ